MVFDQELYEKKKKQIDKEFEDLIKKDGSLFEKDMPKKIKKGRKYKTKMPKMGFY